ncbi:hypothetical protein ZA09F30_24170 [Escherichia coli]
MKRKIIVACGGAVATSTMAAEEIKELCQNHNIPVELIQCRVNEIETYMDGVHLGNDSNLLIVFYVQIMPDDFVMQLHRF